MGERTAIEWTDSTWNPIRGVKGRWHCTHVSEGCRSCYAERLNIRWGGPAYKPGADTFRLDEKILQQPLHWKKPRKIFVCDMTDLFHGDISDEIIDQVFAVMAIADHHTFQVLTKRPRRMRGCLSYFYRWAQIELAAYSLVGRNNSPGLAGGRRSLPNVWLGVSVEDKKNLGRIELLRQTPASLRFLSLEPLLDDLGELDLRGIGWVIIGGESGPKARPMDIGWLRSIVEQCNRVGVPVFVKQDSGRRPGQQGRIPDALWTLKQLPDIQRLMSDERIPS
jgi:protein gp37